MNDINIGESIALVKQKIDDSCKAISKVSTDIIRFMLYTKEGTIPALLDVLKNFDIILDDMEVSSAMHDLYDIANVRSMDIDRGIRNSPFFTKAFHDEAINAIIDSMRNVLEQESCGNIGGGIHDDDIIAIEEVSQECQIPDMMPIMCEDLRLIYIYRLPCYKTSRIIEALQDGSRIYDTAPLST